MPVVNLAGVEVEVCPDGAVAFVAPVEAAVSVHDGILLSKALPLPGEAQCGSKEVNEEEPPEFGGALARTLVLTQQDQVAGRTRLARPLREVIDAEKRSLARATAHVGRADPDLWRVRHR